MNLQRCRVNNVYYIGEYNNFKFKVVWKKDNSNYFRKYRPYSN